MNTSLSDVRDQYMEINKRISSNTRDLTRRGFRYLIEAVGDKPIAAFRFEDAELFQTHLADFLKPVSVNIYTKTIRPVFRWAKRREIIDTDPFANLGLFRVPKKRVRIFEPDDCQSLVAAARNKLWRARILLALTAGLRRGEVLNLTVDDVDFEAGVIYIEPKEDTLRTWRWDVKDIDRREVPMTEEVSTLLAQILMELPPRQPYLMLTHNRYRRLMQLKDAGLLKPRLRVTPDENFTKPFSRMLRFAGIRSGTFHDLRRTCITRWLENGLKPHEVMALAGHSHIDTTMRYYVATRRDLLDRARRASQKPHDFERSSKSNGKLGVTGLEPATS